MLLTCSMLRGEGTELHHEIFDVSMPEALSERQLAYENNDMAQQTGQSGEGEWGLRRACSIIIPLETPSKLTRPVCAARSLDKLLT